MIFCGHNIKCCCIRTFIWITENIQIPSSRLFEIELTWYSDVLSHKIWRRILALTITGASHPMGSKSRATLNRIFRLVTGSSAGEGDTEKQNWSDSGLHFKPTVEITVGKVKLLSWLCISFVKRSSILLADYFSRCIPAVDKMSTNCCLDFFTDSKSSPPSNESSI